MESIEPQIYLWKCYKFKIFKFDFIELITIISKIKEKTGIQTLKVNNKLLLSRMLLFKILLH